MHHNILLQMHLTSASLNVALPCFSMMQLFNVLLDGGGWFSKVVIWSVCPFLQLWACTSLLVRHTTVAIPCFTLECLERGVNRFDIAEALRCIGLVPETQNYAGYWPFLLPHGLTTRRVERRHDVRRAQQQET